MAADADILQLRLFVDEPDDELPYTDAKLGQFIDAASGNLNLAAHNVWTAKAAATAGLVNVTEGGSSRSLGDLQKQALIMAKHYGDKVDGGTEVPARATRVHKLTR